VDHKDPTLAKRQTSKSLLRTSKIIWCPNICMLLTS